MIFEKAEILTPIDWRGSAAVLCGFAGFTGQILRREEILSAMRDKIKYRGPDSAGSYFDEQVALGFRRLSIVDLSQKGDQPMQNEDGSVVCMANGEIYNHQALRAALCQAGHRFRSQCDTEVLLHGYEEYGTDLPRRLRGMFAFCIWDKKRQQLFFARDPFGIKPLFYTQLPDGNLLFASEIKCFFSHPQFEKKLNPAAILPYLSLQYAVPEAPFFARVQELAPGHTLTYRYGILTDTAYHTFAPFAKQTGSDCPDLLHCLEDSVQLHRQADVAVGAFLSGGVDSGLLCALLRPEKTFSVGFLDTESHGQAPTGKFDETPLAQTLADTFGFSHTSRTLDAQACMDALPKIQYHMEEPYANPSVLPLWFLCQEAAKQVKVVLSGEGADELFGGYETYADSVAVQRWKRLPAWMRRGASDLVCHLPYFPGHDGILRADGRPERHFLGQAEIFFAKEARAFLRPAYRDYPDAWEYTAKVAQTIPDADEVSYKQQLDLRRFLPLDILRKADRMSMAASLELRVPYLDTEVLALALSLPVSERVRGTCGKVALRRAAETVLPHVVAERKKKGFPVPIRYWFLQPQFAKMLRTAFQTDAAAQYFDPDRLCALLDAHTAGKGNYGRKLFTVYTFLVWHHLFLEGDIAL